MSKANLSEANLLFHDYQTQSFKIVPIEQNDIATIVQTELLKFSNEDEIYKLDYFTNYNSSQLDDFLSRSDDTVLYAIMHLLKQSLSFQSIAVAFAIGFATSYVVKVSTKVYFKTELVHSCCGISLYT